jgi:hypothetical protein
MEVACDLRNFFDLIESVLPVLNNTYVQIPLKSPWNDLEMQWISGGLCSFLM